LPDDRKLHRFHFEGAEYVMQEADFEEDVAFQEELTFQPSNRPHTARLWRRRITVALVEPRLSEQELSRRNFKFWSAMIAQWTRINDPSKADFLAPEKSEQSSTSTMPAAPYTSSLQSLENSQEGSG